MAKPRRHAIPGCPSPHSDYAAPGWAVRPGKTRSDLIRSPRRPIPEIAHRLPAAPALSLMNWPLSFLISLLTGIASLFGTAFLTTFLIRWFRISSFEGGSGYYAVALSLLGGIAGLFVGLVCARIVAAQPAPGFLKALGVSLGAALAILLLVALACRLCADVEPRRKDKSPKTPPPSPAEIAAKREATEQAAFNAIPADAPIERWLPYTEYGARKDFLDRAVKNIESRPGLAAELGTLINGDDHDLAARALRLIRHFDTFPPDLNAQVAASGRKIAALIHIFNTTPLADDPSMMIACHASQRFHGWMDAVRALRERNRGDFTPELQEILTLSRIRIDSHAIQADIRRVASYYLHEWANIAPLPGDPPPR